MSTDTGELYLFEDLEFRCLLPTSPADGSALHSLAAFTKGFVAGGANGVLRVYERSEDPREFFRCLKVRAASRNSCVASALRVSASMRSGGIHGGWSVRFRACVLPRPPELANPPTRGSWGWAGLEPQTRPLASLRLSVCLSVGLSVCSSASRRGQVFHIEQNTSSITNLAVSPSEDNLALTTSDHQIYG